MKKTLGLFKTKKSALKQSSSFRKQELKDRKDRPRRFGYRTYRVEKTKGKSWKVVSTFKRYKKK
tara:strand:- start:146 stop:337 length:192 start_codon:yes stop_codon:yes gene_type:complete